MGRRHPRPAGTQLPGCDMPHMTGVKFPKNDGKRTAPPRSREGAAVLAVAYRSCSYMRGAGGRSRTGCLPLTRRLLWPAELHRRGARGRIRTANLPALNGAPLPVGLQGQGEFDVRAEPGPVGGLAAGQDERNVAESEQILDEEAFVLRQ